MAQLKSLREIDTTLGDVPAVIRAKNLQCTAEGPSDSWGRRGKLQPMFVSADVSLDKPFGSSSFEDTVAADTVHYGLLSKAILASLANLKKESAANQLPSLYDVLNNVWVDLTGFNLRGIPKANDKKEPFLQMSAIRNLRISLQLPKASRLGGTVSLTGSASFKDEGARSIMHTRGLSLQIQDLRLPVLIGVNDNERTGRQVVVANFGVDRLEMPGDIYCGLEQVIEETMNASSFETLEALAAGLSVRTTDYLFNSIGQPDDLAGYHLTIGLEKPIAVPLADVVCVELRTNTNKVPGVLRRRLPGDT